MHKTYSFILSFLFITVAQGMAGGSNSLDNDMIAQTAQTVAPLEAFDPASPASVETAFGTLTEYPLIGLPGETDQAVNEPASLKLGLYDGALWFYVVAVDHFLHNKADSFNDFIFRYGDTLELFVEINDSNEYYEFHFSPQNQRMQLYWSETLLQQRKDGKLKLEEGLVWDEELLDHYTWLEGNQWHLLVRLPLSVIGISPEKGGEIHLSVSRYNYDQAGDFSLSSTSHHKEQNFHVRSEWLPFEISPDGNVPDASATQ